VPREGFVQHVEQGIRRGHTHEHPSAGNQHAAHFPERGLLVRHELQPELTEDNVERAVWQRHRFGAGFVPLDCRA
jgi:hypothetical protein